MAQASISQDDRELHQHCRRACILARQAQPITTELEAEKEWIRIYVESTGQGGSIEVPGQGEVEFRVGSEAKVKGFTYTLDQAAFADLSESRREKLIADGVVSKEVLSQPARKPSVTIRL